MIDDLIKKMLVGNSHDCYSGAECEVVLREIMRRAEAGEALLQIQEPEVEKASEPVIIQMVASA